MKIKNIILFLVAINFVGLAFADQVPIEDLSSGNSSVAVTSDTQNIATNNMTVDQRVARLEQQMQNLTSMNMPQQLDQLQQQVQQLQGQLQLQQHNLMQLSKQLRTFYQDLNQRIGQAKGVKTNLQPPVGILPVGLSIKPNGNSAAAMFSKDQQDYQAAFALLQNKKYDAAIKALQNYLTNYPQGKYVANTYYWLGELYYLQSYYDKSVDAFNQVVTKYPQSVKVPDSLYKLGMIYKIQNKPDQSTQVFTELQKNYANSAAARLAQQQTQQNDNG